MKDRELDKWIAEHIMGWKEEKRYGTPPYGIFYWVDESGDYKWIRPSEGWEAWHPTESISDAFQVVEKMKEKGYSYCIYDTCSISSVMNACFCIFKHSVYPPDIGDANGFMGYEIEPSMAICLAAKKAIEGVK